MKSAIPLMAHTAGVESQSRSRPRAIVAAAAAGLMFNAAAAAMFIVSVFTLFRARRFCAEVIGRCLGRAMLWVCGIRMTVHGSGPSPDTQVVYLANHTSTLDVFILLALGLPRTRFFLWGGLRKLPPVAVTGYLTGVFFTPSQSRPDRRVACFQHAEWVLRRTGDSVLLSPEGRCVTIGGISRFNRGAFHLATNLKAPVVPVFISIPRSINPGRGYGALPGVVHVYFNAAIPTTNWKLETLEVHKESVRDLYLGWERRLQCE